MRVNLSITAQLMLELQPRSTSLGSRVSIMRQREYKINLRGDIRTSPEER